MYGKRRLVKESSMGIVFEENTKVESSVEVAGEPSWGTREVSTLHELITNADIMPGGPVREAMYDCINNRYRTKAYRDHIKEMQDKGYISDAHVKKMADMLCQIRHRMRTPRAKAFRRQWP